MQSPVPLRRLTLNKSTQLWQRLLAGLFIGVITPMLANNATAQDTRNQESAGQSPAGTIIHQEKGIISGGDTNIHGSVNFGPTQPVINSWRDKIDVDNFEEFLSWLDKYGGDTIRQNILHIAAPVDAEDAEDGEDFDPGTRLEGDFDSEEKHCVFEGRYGESDFPDSFNLYVDCRISVHDPRYSISGYYILKSTERVGHFYEWYLERVPSGQVELRNPRFKVYEPQKSAKTGFPE